MPAPGCYLDGSRGHYLTRDVVYFAKAYGFHVDGFAQWAVDGYDKYSSDSDFPHEELVDLSDKAVEFLNDVHGLPGHTWTFNDGDFGLYPVEDEG